MPLRLIIALLLSLPVLTPARARASEAPLPETCYLFAYFYHHLAGDGLRLAWSTDGLKWQVLGGDRSYLRPEVGEARLLRDPFLFRGQEGLYHLLWTTAWRGKTIGHATSADLIHWSAQQAIPVMAQEPQALNCWAPEAVWDPAARHYVVFWSTTILGRFRETEFSNKGPEGNHRIYATTTMDFETFTPTKLFYDGGFNVIDATIERCDDGTWVMFVKNETARPAVEKNIRMIRAKTLEGPFSEPSAALTGDYWAEGPSVVRVGEEWRVYFDKHRANKYGLIASKDLQHWTDRSEQTDFPPNARHGSLLAVPRAVIEKLLSTAPVEASGRGANDTAAPRTPDTGSSVEAPPASP